MMPIDIYVNRQMDGITFNMSPLTRKRFYEAFPNAHPSGSVFVNYDTKAGFETYHNRVERFIVPILLGLDDEESLAKIGQIKFIDPATNDTLYTYSHSHE